MVAEGAIKLLLQRLDGLSRCYWLSLGLLLGHSKCKVDTLANAGTKCRATKRERTGHPNGGPNRNKTLVSRVSAPCSSCCPMRPRFGPFTRVQRTFGLKDLNRLPTASQVLTAYLEKRNSVWTSFFLPYKSVINDHWGWSHFNWSAGGHNYHILRTGCYPYMKYHCSRRAEADLSLEDNFFIAIKLLNLGKKRNLTTENSC